MAEMIAISIDATERDFIAAARLLAASDNPVMQIVNTDGKVFDAEVISVSPEHKGIVYIRVIPLIEATAH